MRADAFAALLRDLVAEQHALDAIVTDLDDAAAAAPTPAEGWDVRATIEHLAGAEALAGRALADPAAFGQPAGDDRRASAAPWASVLDRWRRERARVADALGARDPASRLPWVAGDMSAASFATARLMETWAHGVDVAHALARPLPETNRLRHIADLGVRTRVFSYTVHGRPAPTADVRVHLDAPDGTAWTWGATDERTDLVRGPARDFCLVVTQRIHVDDTALRTSGPFTREWMEIAQAFAGPPTTPRRGRLG